jgi:hypothetical protein
MGNLRLSKLIILLHILVWVGSPALALSDGTMFDSHPGISEIADSRAIAQAIDSVDTDELTNISEADLSFFAGYDVSVPVTDTNTHSHTSLDGCCGLGGIVCDGTILPAYVAAGAQTGRFWLVRADTSPLSINVPTLRHPPKTQT